MENESLTKRANVDSVLEMNGLALKRIEYAVKSIQKHLKVLIESTPNSAELMAYVESPSEDEVIVNDYKESRLLQFASKLKTKYQCGQLPILDNIIHGNLELFSSDYDIKNSTYQDELGDSREKLGRVDDEMKVVGSDKEEKCEEGEEKDDEYEPGEVEGEERGEMGGEEGEENGFPSLPPIADKNLRHRVFLHKSIVNNLTYLEQEESINLHNERLEFLGDSVLNHLVTLIIYEKLPHASEGELSRLRSLLVNNHVLTEFSYKYGLDKKLRSNIHESALKLGKQKIYADIFEAYIGGLVADKTDYSVVRNWLTKLFAPKIDEFKKKIGQKEPVNKDAKSDLYSFIGSALMHPQYEIVRHGDGSSRTFIIDCRMGDDVLGSGEALNHKEAGLRAAMAALKNEPLLNKYAAYRLSLDRSVSVVSEKKELVRPGPVKFPLEDSTDSDYVNMDAKNELYGILFKNLRDTPEYVTLDIGDNKKKSELRVNGNTVAVGVDTSKRRLLSRAAMTLLNNKAAMDYLMTELNNE